MGKHVYTQPCMFACIVHVHVHVCALQDSKVTERLSHLQLHVYIHLVHDYSDSLHGFIGMAIDILGYMYIV